MQVDTRTCLELGPVQISGNMLIVEFKAVIIGTMCKVDMVLFIRDKHDVVCWLLTSADDLGLLFYLLYFLADRTNGHAIGTVLRLLSVCLW